MLNLTIRKNILDGSSFGLATINRNLLRINNQLVVLQVLVPLSDRAKSVVVCDHIGNRMPTIDQFITHNDTVQYIVDSSGDATSGIHTKGTGLLNESLSVCQGTLSVSVANSLAHEFRST